MLILVPRKLWLPGVGCLLELLDSLIQCYIWVLYEVYSNVNIVTILAVRFISFVLINKD